MFKNRTFITHIVPKSLIEKLPVSPAGNYFSYNLIDSNLFDRVISLIPPNVEEIIDVQDDKIEYIQTKKFKSFVFSKILNVILDNFTLFFKIDSKSNVWFYNLTYHTIFAFFLIKIFKRDVKTFIIVLDFTPTKKKISFQKLLLVTINRFADGLITLKDAPEITNVKKVTIPGIVPNIITKEISSINSKFLLSGILSKNRNPKLILESFSKFPEYDLIITGIVEDLEMLKKYTARFENIKFLGLLQYAEYMKVLEEVTYCINSRDPNFEENNFNFPSKVIEHLQHNKIIISTMQYDELNGINYYYIEPSENEFIKFLQTLKTESKEFILLNYANQSKSVLEKFGRDKWAESLATIEN